MNQRSENNIESGESASTEATNSSSSSDNKASTATNATNFDSYGASMTSTPDAQSVFAVALAKAMKAQGLTQSRLGQLVCQSWGNLQNDPYETPTETYCDRENRRRPRRKAL